MTIQQAIEKAVEGKYPKGNAELFTLERLVLDPAFWRALSKTEAEKTVFKDRKSTQEEWASNMMHRLIDHLADGGTIEGYFETH